VGSLENKKGVKMPNMEMFMLGFIVLVAGVGVGWFIYDSRSDEEK